VSARTQNGLWQYDLTLAKVGLESLQTGLRLCLISLWNITTLEHQGDFSVFGLQGYRDRYGEDYLTSCVVVKAS